MLTVCCSFVVFFPVFFTILCALQVSTNFISRYSHLPTPGVRDGGIGRRKATQHRFLGFQSCHLHLCPFFSSFWSTWLRDWFCGSVTPGLAVRQRCGKSESLWLVLAVEGNSMSFKVQWCPVTGSTPDLRSRVSGDETQESGHPQPPDPEAMLPGRGPEIQLLHPIAVVNFHLWYALISMPLKWNNDPTQCLEQSMALLPFQWQICDPLLPNEYKPWDFC